MFDYSFFRMQAETVARMIATEDPLGPVGESRQHVAECIHVGVHSGWDADSYRNWFAGYVRAARQLKAITPAQEDELYEIVQIEAESLWHRQELFQHEAQQG